MYNAESNIVFGFHGCERILAERLVNNPSENLHYSEHLYDWLGKGMYFWENDPERALEWAKNSSKIKDPAVLGAAISLGNCLDFMQSKNIDELKKLYESYIEIGIKVPENKNIPNGDFEFKQRFADCFLINNYMYYQAKNKNISYDTVRGVFWEGDEIYKNAGFKQRNHIQISVINPNCIKAFFLPRMFQDFSFNDFMSSDSKLLKTK
ncbi:hypothetical protein [Treponema sp.]|uniref:hypothetical protein n=1 Tax=Treponema sp. TaxID=166 RepID=UPI00298DB60D|nr:hypothetical protein [Treponema sp.]MCR5612536.1 hypothetical protein [Treponema sp.]